MSLDATAFLPRPRTRLGRKRALETHRTRVAAFRRRLGAKTVLPVFVFVMLELLREALNCSDVAALSGSQSELLKLRSTSL